MKMAKLGKVAKQLQAPKEKAPTQQPKAQVKIDPALEALPDCCEERSPKDAPEYNPCNKPATKRVKGLAGDTWRMCDECAVEFVGRHGGYIVGPWKIKKHEYDPSYKRDNSKLEFGTNNKANNLFEPAPKKKGKRK